MLLVPHIHSNSWRIEVNAAENSSAFYLRQISMKTGQIFFIRLNENTWAVLYWYAFLQSRLHWKLLKSYQCYIIRTCQCDTRLTKKYAFENMSYKSVLSVAIYCIMLWISSHFLWSRRWVCHLCPVSQNLRNCTSKILSPHTEAE
jgi:hypothetical protein